MSLEEFRLLIGGVFYGSVNARIDIRILVTYFTRNDDVLILCRSPNLSAFNSLTNLNILIIVFFFNANFARFVLNFN